MSQFLSHEVIRESRVFLSISLLKFLESIGSSNNLSLSFTEWSCTSVLNMNVSTCAFSLSPTVRLFALAFLLLRSGSQSSASTCVSDKYCCLPSSLILNFMLFITSSNNLLKALDPVFAFSSSIFSSASLNLCGLYTLSCFRKCLYGSSALFSRSELAFLLLNLIHSSSKNIKCFLASVDFS